MLGAKNTCNRRSPAEGHDTLMVPRRQLLNPPWGKILTVCTEEGIDRLRLAFSCFPVFLLPTVHGD
jgi:hypothetical protein